MEELDETLDPERRSFVGTANVAQADFPIQNLPYGVFRRAHTDEALRVGIAIGDQIFDLSRVQHLFGAAAAGAVRACAASSLNELMGLSVGSWEALRCEAARLLDERTSSSNRSAVARNLVPMVDAQMSLPVKVGDFTDFYASIFHATNAGRIIRPDNPLLPNYKFLPVAYHSRVSSIRLSGATVRRPNGQIKSPQREAPQLAPTARLDYETELGLYIGTSSTLGSPIPISSAGRHVFGYCLLNDWSARDLQVWEYQPLGPFLAKNFATTVSAWVVPAAALRPFRVPAFARATDDPAPLPHLTDSDDQREGAIDIELETYLLTPTMRKAGQTPAKLGTASFANTYWTVAQMIAHHTSNGCNLLTGDLLGSGTVSGPEHTSWGSLLELTQGGATPLHLPNGEQRRFLEDGDEIILRGHCSREGAVRIGFGECRGTVLAALPIAETD
jgi:fumarylacetoacetase